MGPFKASISPFDTPMHHVMVLIAHAKMDKQPTPKQLRDLLKSLVKLGLSNDDILVVLERLEIADPETVVANEL